MEKRKIDLNTINIPKSHALFDYYIKDILELFVCQVSPTLYRLIHVTRDPIEGLTRYFKEIAEFDGKTTQANILRSLHQFNQNNQLSQVFMITIRCFWKNAHLVFKGSSGADSFFWKFAYVQKLLKSVCACERYFLQFS